MTPAGPNRRGLSARRAHRQACARSANSVRCSGLTPKVLKPTRTAGRRAVIKGSPHRWPSRPQPTRRAAKSYVYASPALGLTARFCRSGCVMDLMLVLYQLFEQIKESGVAAVVDVLDVPQA